MKTRRQDLGSASWWTAMLFAIATFALGCGLNHAGTLFGPAIARAPIPRHPRASLSVAAITDDRPPEEHSGASVGTRLFIFFGVGVYVQRQGNYVTDDHTASPIAPIELRTLAVQTIAESGVVTRASEGGEGADFELHLAIEHLYGTHYAANEQLAVVAKTKTQTTAVVDAQTHEYGAYGDVTLNATLIDRRGSGHRVVWSEHVSGYAQRPPAPNRLAEVQAALQLATADALSTLSQRLGAALDRIGAGPSGAPVALASGGALPQTFAIERMSRFRDFEERVVIESATGRVLRHVIFDAPDRYASRPGDWLLSRVTSEGNSLSPDGYEALARSLAERFDLRVVDDAAHYHFFGLSSARDLARDDLGARPDAVTMAP